MVNSKIPVGVLAGTGAVGQRFVSILAEHPWFEVVAVTGSSRTEGTRYADTVHWVLPGDPPEAVADLIVAPTTVDLPGAALLFSALPKKIALEVEPEFAAAGFFVCTNASAYRMAPDVPLLIPEINADHLALLQAQRAERGWQGAMVASPNCAASGIVFPLKALDDAFGLERVHAVTLQAISGAGYPGVSAMDIYDNVIPNIGGEEDKIEEEPRKMLGRYVDGAIEMADFAVSAQVHRVPVTDGHTAAMSIGLKSKVGLDDVRQALAEYAPADRVAELPSATTYPIAVRSEQDRPQPRLDRDAQGGMGITVGRIQDCEVLDVKMVSLVHNTLRGAASGAILNAELLVAEGVVERATA